jgi:peptidyl-prolyl cis-trans isomerase A (cyclophilin A)
MERTTSTRKKYSTMNPLARALPMPYSFAIALKISALALLVTGTSYARAENPRVEFKTTMGAFTLELYPDKAPKTVENFLQYVNSGFYKGTIFHRVIDNFMIQGGGFNPDMKQKETRGPIENEAGIAMKAGLKNELGTIAMARTSIPNSATAQFFINVKDNGFLDYKDPSPQGIGYAVFGRVIEGMNTVLRISRVDTTTVAGNQNVPQRPIIIESVTVKSGK